jgi:hypothetical protein
LSNDVASSEILLYYNDRNGCSHSPPARKERSTMTKEEPVKKPPMTYADYLKGAIIETVSELSEEQTLKYIYTMLMGAVTAGTPTADC